jgi:uncharacterized coiled-coil DUF342 family protein
MEIRVSDPALDYEDLVDELDQFEQDAKSLKERIAQFMQDAQEVTADGVDSGAEQTAAAS